MSTVMKILTWVLAVLVLLGVAGGAAYLALRSRGMTFTVEYDGKQYLSNSDGDGLDLKTGQTHFFQVKSLTGGEVNYTVRVMANGARDFAFGMDGKMYRFYGTEQDNDYTEQFGIHRDREGFTLTIPEGYTVLQAIGEKYGGKIEPEILPDPAAAYFILSVTADENTVGLWFRLYTPVADVSLGPPGIVF